MILLVHSSLESSHYFPVEKDSSTRKILNVIDGPVIRFLSNKPFSVVQDEPKLSGPLHFLEEQWEWEWTWTEWLNTSPCVCSENRLCVWTYREWENVHTYGWWRPKAAASEEQRCAMAESRWKVPKYNSGIWRGNEIPLHRGGGFWLNLTELLPRILLKLCKPTDPQPQDLVLILSSVLPKHILHSSGKRRKKLIKLRKQPFFFFFFSVDKWDYIFSQVNRKFIEKESYGGLQKKHILT